MKTVAGIAVVVLTVSAVGCQSPSQDGPEVSAEAAADVPDKREAQIVQVGVADGGRQLLVSVDACNAESNTVEVDESAEVVRVLVTTTDPVGGDDCADGVRVELDEPLGDRTLVDASTGEAVEVSP